MVFLQSARVSGASVSYVRSVRGRLSILFSAMFAMILLLGVASIWSLSHSNEVATDVRDRWLPNVRLLGDLNNFTSDFRTAEASSLLAASSGELDSSLREIRLLDQAIVRAQNEYEKIHHSGEEAELYRQFNTTWSIYKTIAGRVTTLASTGHTADGAAIYRSSSQTTYDAASNLLGRLTDYNTGLAARASKRSAAAYEQARGLLGVTLAVAGLMLAIVIAQVRQQISFPLLDLGRAMHQLAASDISVEIGHTTRNDEIGEMARAVVVFRANAIELIHSQRGLAQQATMLEEKLAHEQSVTQMQRNFVSMITHEFRTPLTQIDAQAQRLARMKDCLLPDDISDRAGRIRSAVARIVRMIDDLVDTTRLMDGDTQLFFHPEAMDLVTVLRGVCRVHREVSPSALILEQYRQTAIPMNGDPKLLFQAFSNLVSNAIKFSSEDAKVTVLARREEDRVVVTVEDEGIGIPLKDREHIFSRYYRGSNVPGFIGSGVGLFLVATVVRLHDGAVTVKSAEGEGSKFIVTLASADGP